jgi:hypothetical protein
VTRTARGAEVQEFLAVSSREAGLNWGTTRDGDELLLNGA